MNTGIPNRLRMGDAAAAAGTAMARTGGASCARATVCIAPSNARPGRRAAYPRIGRRGRPRFPPPAAGRRTASRPAGATASRAPGQPGDQAVTIAVEEMFRCRRPVQRDHQRHQLAGFRLLRNDSRTGVHRGVGGEPDCPPAPDRRTAPRRDGFRQRFGFGHEPGRGKFVSGRSMARPRAGVRRLERLTSVVSRRCPRPGRQPLDPLRQLRYRDTPARIRERLSPRSPRRQQVVAFRQLVGGQCDVNRNFVTGIWCRRIGGASVETRPAGHRPAGGSPPNMRKT